MKRPLSDATTNRSGYGEGVAKYRKFFGTSWVLEVTDPFSGNTRIVNFPPYSCSIQLNVMSNQKWCPRQLSPPPSGWRRPDRSFFAPYPMHRVNPIALSHCCWIKGLSLHTLCNFDPIWENSFLLKTTSQIVLWCGNTGFPFSIIQKVDQEYFILKRASFMGIPR